MNTLTTSGESAERSDVAAVEMLTRALVGIALDAVRSADPDVTLPQFRLLLALEGLGRVPSSKLASRLGLAASAITRMVDRLEQAGLVQRGTDQGNRTIVTVELTAAGRRLVTSALAHRKERLAVVLDRMSADDREAAVRVALQFARLSGDAVAVGAAGPVPL
ncbi:MAG TPA: MarR family transcriptional regulator [Trebonia sp.]|nr:MarR family transcriptional regulator [Trebonia sp.]